MCRYFGAAKNLKEVAELFKREDGTAIRLSKVFV